MLLYALGDPIVFDTGTNKEGQGIRKLGQIRKMVFLRNHSIFAHGLGPVGFQDFTKFKDFVLELFEKFCEIEQIPYRQYRENMVWINPTASRYYAGMVEF